MPIPTDQGRVVIRSEVDGTTTVIVCSDVVRGQPVNPYAMHVQAPSVAIDSRVRLVGEGQGVKSTPDPVMVSMDEDGTVRVAPAAQLIPSRR